MRTEVAIIGAGPAGMSAACLLDKLGIEVTVVDEQQRPGGQISRQPPATFQVSNWLQNHIYQPQHRLLDAVENCEGVRWLHGTTALGISTTAEGLDLCLNGPDGAFTLHAGHVLIAAGCHDMPVAFPGSTVPGVMAVGGIQAFVKSQLIVPGERFVFSGSHPLQLIVADQVSAAGGKVAAVCFSQPPALFLQALRHSASMLRYPGKMLYFLSACIRLMRRGIPIYFGRVVTRAEGTEALTSVSLRDSRSLADDSVFEIDCDRLGVGFGFLANSQLAQAAGAQCHWSDESGGWLVETDEWMKSSTPGIYVAGELTGIGGADVSEQEGSIAALGIATASGRITQEEANSMAKGARRSLKPLNRFATTLSQLAHPGTKLLNSLIQDDSIVCKCEEVSAQAIKGIIESGPSTPDSNSVKLQSRCGMGLCQGRYCQYTLRVLLAASAKEAAEPEAFTSRFPLKPVTLGALAGLTDRKDNPEARCAPGPGDI